MGGRLQQEDKPGSAVVSMVSNAAGTRAAGIWTRSQWVSGQDHIGNLDKITMGIWTSLQ
jgi:hypothetical protein